MQFQSQDILQGTELLFPLPFVSWPVRPHGDYTQGTWAEAVPPRIAPCEMELDPTPRRN